MIDLSPKDLPHHQLCTAVQIATDKQPVRKAEEVDAKKLSAEITKAGWMG